MAAPNAPLRPPVGGGKPFHFFWIDGSGKYIDCCSVMDRAPRLAVIKMRIIKLGLAANTG